ncbi:hypothetical protein [Fusibacter sp. JL216-2]|uniref:hypothetical protein n=1 Tax=Fusibacter sp. JL216-2 TaxID=3071453 RepID=UPI003D3539C0
MKIKIEVVLLCIVVIFFTLSPSYALEQEYLTAPTISMLDVPNTLLSGEPYLFEWSALGYQEDYSMVMQIIEKDTGNELFLDEVFSIKQETSVFSYNGVSANEYYFESKVNLEFTKPTELLLRFYAKPEEASSSTPYVSCLIPPEMGISEANSLGRSIKIFGCENIEFKPNVNLFAASVSNNTDLKVELSISSEQNFTKGNPFGVMPGPSKDNGTLITFNIDGLEDRAVLSYIITMPQDFIISEMYMSNLNVGIPPKPKENDILKFVTDATISALTSTVATSGDHALSESSNKFANSLGGFKIIGKTFAIIPACYNLLESESGYTQLEFMYSDTILGKGVYPYNTFTGNAYINNEDFSSSIVFYTEKSIGEVLSAIEDNRIAYYINTDSLQASAHGIKYVKE